MGAAPPGRRGAAPGVRVLLDAELELRHGRDDPYAGVGLADGGRTWRLGSRFEYATRICSSPRLMADQRAAEQPDSGASDTTISQPHDKYFQRVFSNERDAASLLRTCVPQPLAGTLKWSTLTHQFGRFLADDWRRNGTDLRRRRGCDADGRQVEFRVAGSPVRCSIRTTTWAS